MHQSPRKLPPRHRDRLVDIEEMEEQAERRAYRAALPKTRRFPLREDEAPRAQSPKEKRP